MDKLPPALSLLIRNFYVYVAQNDDLWSGDVVGQRMFKHKCLDFLDYYVVNDKYVKKNKLKKATYGVQPDYVCTWEEDTKADEKAAKEVQARGDDPYKTYSSKSSKGASIWEGIFS